MYLLIHEYDIYGVSFQGQYLLKLGHPNTLMAVKFNQAWSIQVEVETGVHFEG